jgi:hypothetical protein
MKKPTTEIETSEVYDQEEDIYYVTVMTGEPSYVVEVDDRLLIEVGLFTDLPTGFRILNYTKHKRCAAVFKDLFKQGCIAAGLRRKAVIEQRHNRLAKFFDTAAA